MKALSLILLCSISLSAKAQQAVAQQWVNDYNSTIASLGESASNDYIYQGSESSSVAGFTDWYASNNSGTQQIVAHVPNGGGQTQVMFFGDSITQFFPMLTEFPQVSWANMGVAGDHCTAEVQRFENDLQVVQPQVAVIACGTNDSYSGVTVVQTEQAIASMVSEAQALGVQVMVATVPPVTSAHPTMASFIRALNGWIRNNGSGLGYHLWERWNPLVDGSKGYGVTQYYEADGVHPLVGAGPDVMAGGNLRWYLSLMLGVPNL